jgi:hypothetical protein
MQATRRALKRRLCDMTRLLDYMLADAVHSMLVRSLQQVLQCLRGQEQQQPAEQSEQPEQQKQGQGLQQGQQQQQRQVVLSVELLLHEHQDQLYLQPQAADFVEGLAVWLRSVGRAVRGLPRLLASAKLQVRVSLCKPSRGNLNSNAHATGCSPHGMLSEVVLMDGAQSQGCQGAVGVLKRVKATCAFTCAATPQLPCLPACAAGVHGVDGQCGPWQPAQL